MFCLKFNKKLYTKKAISSAKKAYQGFCNFERTKEDKGYWQVCFKNINQETANLIKDEFSNYLLCLMR